MKAANGELYTWMGSISQSLNPTSHKQRAKAGMLGGPPKVAWYQPCAHSLVLDCHPFFFSKDRVGECRMTAGMWRDHQGFRILVIRAATLTCFESIEWNVCSDNLVLPCPSHSRPIYTGDRTGLRVPVEPPTPLDHLEHAYCPHIFTRQHAFGECTSDDDVGFRPPEIDSTSLQTYRILSAKTRSIGFCAPMTWANRWEWAWDHVPGNWTYGDDWMYNPKRVTYTDHHPSVTFVQ